MDDKHVNEWKTRDFQLYLQELHLEYYGFKYSARNYGMEAKHLKAFMRDYGNEALKLFIELCFEHHKPNDRYPGLNFMFMSTYLRERWLPIALKEIAKQSEPVEVTDHVNPIVEPIDENWW